MNAQIPRSHLAIAGVALVVTIVWLGALATGLTLLAQRVTS